ncbi:non-ribosomal peptide synthase/polyketide synthase [Catellatospora sp. KI3]|uniref:non-ribosomal peptide synthase/polyketide synthase n=1 Tax=Catellatospora sp. KI3 TaxID=3041620 RepID=UPI0024822B0E|nr:non-ribosomal peptide synthetase [Catellatospora sp. KI3]MDI1461646.1 non-ribosomal peptide synthase/polyketide synthase [Catellatospora sp. KI3]
MTFGVAEFSAVPSTITTVPKLFADQAARTPQALALVAGQTRLTYAELATRVWQLAHHLRARGLRPEETVAVSTPRSAEMVVAVLAVMSAGGAFVPVDPAWPAERREKVRADAGARLVVAAPGHPQGVPAGDLVEVDLADWGYGTEPAQPLHLPIPGAALAYVIFTSGSTGRPKGAMIRHEAICNRLLWQVEQILHFGPGDASLFKAPLAFDISVNEILLPLVSGGYVVVADPDGERDPHYLLDLISRERVTFVYLVSSMLDVLLEMARGTTLLDGLRHVWCGGEVLTPELFERFRRQLTTTLYHGYGPAEATIGVSHVIYRDQAERIATSIGRANPYTQLYVLDERLEPVPTGEVGELYAAGFLLGRGYVNAPSLTGARFVANPFDGRGTRMYRTGDLARFAADGSLDFVGRADNQVKIRGMRLELEEVEAVLAGHPAVRRAAVVVHTGTAAAQLAAYATVDAEVTAQQLRAWCADRLPEYMVPGTVTILDAFPVTANGKVDRRALPDPAAPERAPRRAPDGPVERLLCHVFADVLGVAEVSADDDFLTLGGDSITAIGVVRRARQAGYVVRPGDILARRTPAALAPAVTAVDPGAAVTAADADGEVPPTPITEWLQDLGPAMRGFFQAMTLRTPAGLTEAQLHILLDAVLAAHPVLRTRATGTPRWTLTVQPAGSVTAAGLTTRRTAPAPAELDATLDRETTAAARRLDPYAGRMLDAVWLDGGPDRDGRLILAVHHIVVDGVSLRVLLEDLRAAWTELSAGRPVRLPGDGTAFRQWARRLGEATRDGVFAAAEAYWRHTCATADPRLGHRPLDPARDTVATERELTVALPPDVSARLLGAVPAAVHGGVDDGLVTAFALALRAWRGGDGPLLLELEGHGREDVLPGEVDLSRTFGWFTTLYPFAVDPGPAGDLGAAVRAVKEQLRAVPHRGLSYGALRYLSGTARPELAAAPQVLFHYLGRFTAADSGPFAAVDGGDIVVERRDPALPLARVVEVNAVAVDTAEGPVLRARFSWAGNLLTADRVAELARGWTDTLTAIAADPGVAGHTPSDFPLAALTQADVTELDAAVPGLRTVLPLSPLQEGLYFHARAATGADPYVVQQRIHLDGPVDPAGLRAAAEGLLARHPHLAAALLTLRDGRTVAATADRVRVPWRDLDLSGLPADTAARRLDEAAGTDRTTAFDLADPPAMRFTLARLDGGRHTLVHTVHHLLADGWSVPLMLRELLALHERQPLPAPVGYDTFLRALAALDTDTAADAWAAALEGVTGPTRLASALAPGTATGYARRAATVPAELTERLRTLAQRHGITVSGLLTAAWGLLVGRRTGSGDAVVGVTVSGRSGDLDGIDDIIGLLVNTVPARVRWRAADPLIAVVARAARAQTGLMEHEHTALSRIHRRTGVGELFDTLVVIENYPAVFDQVGALRVTGVDTVEAPHYPVTVMAKPGQRIDLLLTHDLSAVDAASAETLLDQYLLLLAALADHPELPVGQVGLVPGERRAALLAASANLREAQPGVLALIDRAAAAAPDRAAVVCGDTALTYAELVAKADRVAGHLRRSGVRRGDIVAVAVGRGVDLATALLAVARTGAAYLPVDPAYPAGRIEFMLADARPVAVLADEATARTLPPHGLPQHTVRAAAAGAPIADPAEPDPADAVSVVYTSGSTGRPKAVVGTHGGLGNRLVWAAEQWSAAPGTPDVRLAKSSLSFIDGTTELLGALVAGATTVIAPERTAADGAALARLVADSGATQLLAVPSLAAAMAEVDGAPLAGVRRWLLSGEALDAGTVRALAAASPGARIVNSYGSSEVVGDVLTADVTTVDGRVPLGTPVPGTRVLLLDETLDLVAAGGIGEVYVGGAQLARGYLGQGGGTAARFVADPFTPGERLYRTGDRARLLPSGQVEFLGRTDDQIKINGYRVELAEVEAALARRIGVAEAVAATRPGSAGTHALHAYVVAEPGESLDPGALRTMLRAELPPYLVPATVTVLDRIPLLPNGKRDRRALPDPAPAARTGGAARTERAERIRRHLAEVLSSTDLGAEDDFFAHGGDSILAIRVVNRLARDDLDVSVEALFRLRTAAAIDAGLAGQAAPAPAALTPADLATVRLDQAEIDRVLAAAPVPVETIWALSPLQRGVYYQAAYADGANTYIAQNVFDFDRRLDLDALRAAFASLLRAHPTLRAGFTGDSVRDVVQYIAADLDATVAVTDLSTLDPGDLDAALARLHETDLTEPFDLTRPPLIRLTVVRLPDDRDQLLLTAHFLLWDGWSRELVLRDLFARYATRGAAGALPPAANGFPEYLTWLAGRDSDAAVAAWRDELSGVTEPTLLVPSAVGRDPLPSHRLLAALPSAVTLRLREQAQRRGVTLHSLLTAVLGLLIGYEAGRTDVVFGTTVAGRPTELPGIEDAIGLFLNTVPVRVRPAPADTVADLARRAQQDRLRLAPHEHLGLGELHRATGHDQLFDTLFVLQNFLADDTFTDLEQRHGITGVGYTDTTHYPYTWVVTPGANLHVKLEFRPDVTDAADARRQLDRFLRLLTRVADGLDTPVARLDPVLDAEAARLRGDWAATEHPLPEATVADLLAERAALIPADTALVFGARSLTYAELDAEVNRYARLLRGRGAGAGTVVALGLPRGVEMVVALFAVLRCGAAYLPMDLDHPVARLADMLDDARPALLLCTTGAAELAGRQRDLGGQALLLDTAELAAELAALSGEPMPGAGPGSLDSPAYVIYTSGSTGRPKGVVTPYRGLTNMQLNHRAEIFDPAVARAKAAGRDRLRVAHTVSFSFDMSWEELLWLVEGHEVHVCDEELRRDATALVAYCREHRVDVVNVTPTYAHHLFEEGLLDPAGYPPSLVLLGGEAVSDAVWQRLRRPGGPIGYNLYGPTEYTINTLGAGTDESATSTVGRPIWNTRAYVLDPWLRPVHPGTAGELYIAGAGLAHGYLNATGLTASRFTADPNVPGGRMYRTGDLVRLRPDGHLDFLGRTDDQVKIRGYRVELGEIETVLGGLPGVRQAAVVAQLEDAVTGRRRLAAYVVPAGAADGVFLAGLRDALAEVLPGYMVPQRYAAVPVLPLTVNGKLDTAALPEASIPDTGATAEPRTDAERTLCGVYAAVLALPRVGIDDDFFTVGGDSISSIAAAARAREAGLHVTPRDVFRRRTVRALAATVTAAAPAAPALAPVAGDGTVPLTPMLAETFQAGTPLSRFHQTMLLPAPAGLDLAGVTAVLRALGECHDLLRLSVDGDVLRVRAAFEPDLVAQSGPPPARLSGAVDAAAARLDAAAGRMTAATWYDEGPNLPSHLLLSVHHLVVDGVSWRVLTDDLARAFAAVAAGRPAALPPVPVRFQDWAARVRAVADAGGFATQEAYWRAVLDTPDPRLGTRDLDPARDTAATVSSVTVTVAADLSTALLTSVPAALRGGVNDGLLTAFAVAVRRWRATPRPGWATTPEQTPVLVNLEGHGRHGEHVGAADADLSRTVGWFTVIHPVALDPGTVGWAEVEAAGPGLAAAARAVKEQLRAVPDNGFGYGVLRYLADGSPWPRTPQILFNYLGRFTGGEGTGVLHEGVHPDNPAQVLEVNAQAQDGPHGPVLSATLSWPTGLMTEDDVRELARLWLAALTALARCAALDGHTPSDFPLVALSQADVDRLARPGRVRDILPLLPLQQGMYFHAAYADSDVDTYRVQQVAELTGPLDAEVLRVAVAATVRRHDALRAAFVELSDGRIAQLIAAEVALPWQAVDLSGRADAEAELARIAAAALAEPFDLAQAPLVRYTLVSLSATEHRLIETMHHIIADGWSYPLVFADVIASYERGGADLPAPAVTFRDHVESVLAHDPAVVRETWARALTGVAPTLLVGTGAGVGHHDSVSGSLSARRTKDVTEAARRHGVTVSTLLHAAWGLLLGQLVDRDRVVFGSTVSGRGGQLPGVESIVGLLINTVPVPMAWQPDQPLGEVLAALQERLTDLLDVQHTGLGELARLAGVREFFDTMVVVENFPAADDTPGASGLRVRGFTGTDAPHYPLALVAFPGERLTLEIKYDTELIGADRARQLLEQVEHIIDRLLTEPTGTVADLAAPSPAMANLSRAYSAAGTDPARVAVSIAGRRLTYADLDARANRLARELLARGVRPQSRVALALPRGLDLVAAVLAVVKAGGCYVPLDTASPPARLRHIIDDSAPVCVITDAATAVALPGATAALILDDPAVAGALAAHPATAPPAAQAGPDDAVYLIYTSGSTGLPKGVVVTHGNVLALFDAGRQRFAFGPADVWTLFHSIAFDFSVWELWGALLHGAHLVVVPEDVARDPHRFRRLLADERVTVLNQTPSAFYPLIAADAEADGPLALRYVVFGGEALDLARLRAWYDRNPATPALVNMYGITETCVHVSFRPLTAADAHAGRGSAIGGPLPGLRAELLDERLAPVPVGAVGELYIAGDQLARGYHGRAGLTAARFVADSGGGRLYRTGDLARRTADGELVYVGRADDQVKIRGYRIELGEVEAAVLALPQVADAAVAVREDEPGRRRLVAYVVPRTGAHLDTGVLRTALATALPGYMVPAAYVLLTALPLTVNGKLDRAALPAPPTADQPEPLPTGANPSTVDRFRALYAEVLRLPGAAAGADFFTLGGDSIIAIQLVNLARRRGLRISPRDVFTLRTPEALAASVGETVPAPQPPAPAAGGDGIGEVALLPIVHRLAELGGRINRLHQAELLLTPAGLTNAQASALVAALVARHDALRLRLDRPDPLLWSLTVAAPDPASAPRVSTLDATGLSDDDLAELVRAVAEGAADSLDPDAGRLLWAVHFDRGPDQQGRLLLVVHHLAVDGVSWRILGDDLRAAWADVAAGREPVLEPVGTSLRAYARAAAEHATRSDRLAEFAHWTAALAPGADLDPTAVTVGLTAGATREHRITVPPHLTAPLLTSVPAAAGADVTQTLLAGLHLAVARWRSRRGHDPAAPLLVDLERHGREPLAEETDLSRTVGWFTAIAPVRLPGLTGDAAQALRAVRDTVSAVRDGGLGFGLLRYLNPRTAAALGRLGTPQLLFNYLGRFPVGGAADWDTAPEERVLRTAPDPDLGTPYLLEVNAACHDTAAGPELVAVLTYADEGLDVAGLAEDWVAALADLAAATGPADLTPAGVDPDEVARLAAAAGVRAEAVWPLSPLQEGLFFQARYAGDADVYVAQNVFDFGTRLDAAALATAFAGVFGRHEATRLGFAAVTGQPVAFVGADLAFDVEVVDLSDRDDPDRLARVLAADRAAPFDLARPPLARLTVLRLPGGRDRLLLTYHLLLWDGWSRELVLRELFDRYAAARDGRPEPALAPPAARFADYLSWLSRQDSAAATGAWTGHLAGLGEPTVLYPAAAGTAPVLATSLAHDLTPEQTAAVTDAARRAGVTLNALLSTALGLTLGYATGRAEAVFGTTVAGRPTDLDGADEVVGVFLNTVPALVRCAPGDTVAAVLRRVQDDRVALMPYEHLGLGAIHQALGRDTLFDSLYVLQNFLDDDTFTDLEQAHGIVDVSAVDATHYPLTWVVTPGRRLRLRLEYRSDVVPAEQAQLLLDRLRQVVLHLAAHPDDSVADVELSLPGDVRQLTGPTGDTPDRTVAELLAERARLVPGRTALTCGDESLTYAELDARVSRFARWLRAAGAGPETIVALALPRSVAAVVALFAVLRCGAAYLPLELDHPDERLAGMLADADPLLLVTTSAVAGRVGGTGVRTRCLDDADTAALLAACADTPLTPAELAGFAPGTPGRLDHPAYVIYTSGSTGRPKGVVTPYRGLTNMQLNHRDEIFDPVVAAAGGRVLAIAHTVSFSFDMSWEELLWLVEGHHVHVCDEELRRDAMALVAYCRRHRVDVVNVTPTFAQHLLDAGLLDASGHRPELVLLGGEAVPQTLWAALLSAGVTGYNLYGPTEYTINTLGAGTADSPTTTVGRPIRDTRVRILDGWLRPVPPGVPGELYISGAGLARGYLNRPGLSASRFTADPEAPGERMYRTGDLVRLRPDGHLDFLGRTDDQVKVRGYRVELGEIEAVLSSLDGVRQTAVLAAPDPAGGKRLVAYVVPADAAADPAELIASLVDRLRDRLPTHLVPSAYAVVNALPLNVNGKLDVAALPPAVPPASSSRKAATPAEAVLCDLFAQALGLPEVGADDDFFTLGGHSLIALRLLGLLRRDLGVEVSVRDLFDARTPARLAVRTSSAAAAEAAVTAGDRPARLPLSAAQERLWLLSQLDPASTAYHYPLTLRLGGAVDPGTLAAALGDVVARHEALRTVIEVDEEGPVQRIRAEAEVELLVHRSAATAGALAEAVAEPFDLAARPPLRASLFLDQAADESVLLLVLHHLAMDEWSDRPLLSDLDTAYAARRTGTSPEFTPLPVQYADYALWQHRRLGDRADPTGRHARERGYWQQRLRALPPETNLPADRPRALTRTAPAAATVEATLPAEVVDGLRERASAVSASLFMALHATVAVLLSRHGAGPDVPIGSPVSGRGDEALTDLVGFFVNTVVVRTDTGGQPTLDALLGRVRDSVLSAFDHAELPFQDVVEAVNPVRVPGRNPLFQVMLGVLHRPAGGDRLLGLPTLDAPAAEAAPKVDLNFTFVEDGPGRPVSVALEFDPDRFDPATARRLLDRLALLVAAAGAAGGGRLDDVDLCTGQDTSELDGWQDGGSSAEPGSWLSAVRTHAARTPLAPAVTSAGVTLSYAELEARSAAFAGRLSGLGVGPTGLVGLALPRSVDLLVALLAVARAGAAYVPLDPAYPASRLRFMVEDARPAVIVTDEATRDLFEGSGCAVVGVGAPDAVTGAADAEVPQAAAAYVIYTSGSTGRPKGVVVTRGDVEAFLSAMDGAVPLGPDDRFLAVTTLSFDIAVLELLGTLRAGGHVVLADDAQARDPYRLAELIRAYGVTVLQATPGLWTMLTEVGEADLTGVRALVGGEALPVPLARELSRRAASVTNLYGPTEVTVWATAATVDESWCDRPSIGRPLPGTTAYVVDERLRPVPPGVAGELYLGGAQIARGYLGRAGLTASRFTADPWTPGGRLYRTGDLARWSSVGELEYLGRTDHQLKVRGFRVELGEIESVAVAYTPVSRAVAVAVPDPAGVLRIVLYVATAGAVTPSGLDEHLARRLPAYMLPSAVVALAQLPVTPNGKVDRAALPPVEFGADAASVAPRTETERQVCAILADLLGVAEVGVADDFFVLGGHSLLLVRLSAALRAAFGVTVPLSALLTQPTAAGMARLVEVPQPVGDALSPLVLLQPSGTRPAVFCLPPASGLSWPFAALKRYLPDTPLIGLQAPRLSRSTDLPTTLPALAAEYADRIEQAAPSGPIRLLGWSFGGAVAHEVAVLLTERGRHVSFLSVLDTYLDRPVVDDSGPVALAELLRELGHEVPEAGLTVAVAARVLRERDPAMAEFTHAQVCTVVENYLDSDRLAGGWVPRPYAGELVFVEAARPSPGFPGGAGAVWSRYAGRVTVHPVACGHGELLDSVPVADWGSVLAAQLKA